MTKPVVYIFCNACDHEWHSAMALAEDGTRLAGHVCSSHGFIPGDMGADGHDDWSGKRTHYEAHYPDGCVTELGLERPKEHAGLMAAVVRAKERALPAKGG